MIDKLKLVCDKNDPADGKLLLLAELFDERCQLLEEHQTEMSSRLESTDRKLDDILKQLQTITNAEEKCPVRRNTESFNLLIFFMEHPKLVIVLMLGLVFVISGFVSHDLWSILRGIFSV